jgi:Zn-dependent M16 (insulinase) family peptidase
MVRVDEYPHRNEQQPSPLAFTWPATRTHLSAGDTILLEIFGDVFAGDSTTNLYKMFVDSKTKVMDIGATGVFNNVDRDQGHPVAFIFDNVAPSNFTPEKIAAIRDKVTAELARVAALPDGSPELKELNGRALSRVAETERQLANFVNTPPAWGARNTGAAWLDHLLLLDQTPEFKKSVTLKPELAAIRKELTSGTNLWRDRLAKWQLTGVTPYAAAARPSPALLQREDAERTQRADAEAKRLAQQYAVSDVQEALKRYRTDQDAGAARIEEEAKKIPQPELVKNPPMTLDDELQFAQSKLASGVPMVTSTFDTMTSATVGLAMRVDGVPREQLRYLSLLPALLSRVGVIENGKPVSYEEMSERLRKEILRLDASFSSNARTERIELVVRGAGLGAAEANRALDWMSLVLNHPDWRPENLPRIRDVVDQSLSGWRNTMQGSEESWVNNPATAYRLQGDPAYLAADSFLTRSHNALRLRWLLKEAPAADRDALNDWFTKLAAAAGARTELKASLAKPELIAALSPAAQAIAKDALKDLDLTMIEIPDGSLAADWSYLVTAMRDDLMTPPADALRTLEALRREVLKRGNARMWQVGSSANQKAIAASVDALASSLAEGASAPAQSGPRHVDARLAARDSAAASRPVYVGLLAPNMKSGVIITSVPSAQFSDAGNRDKELDYLASRLYSGYGAHGVFLKTIGAGLAYSNGLRGSVQGGRAGYYAERTPEIPQTVKFVIDILKNAERDPRLADYSVAQVFGESRASGTYESRAEGMANDLADKQSPEQVRAFRTAILELRKEPNLGNTLFDRKDAVYGRGLPGYNVKGKDVADAVYFAIGPDKQLDAWEGYLRNAEGPETKLFRLYPRDFWMP